MLSGDMQFVMMTRNKHIKDNPGPKPEHSFSPDRGRKLLSESASGRNERRQSRRCADVQHQEAKVVFQISQHFRSLVYTRNPHSAACRLAALDAASKGASGMCSSLAMPHTEIQLA